MISSLNYIIYYISNVNIFFECFVRHSIKIDNFKLLVNLNITTPNKCIHSSYTNSPFNRPITQNFPIPFPIKMNILTISENPPHTEIPPQKPNDKSRQPFRRFTGGGGVWCSRQKVATDAVNLRLLPGGFGRLTLNPLISNYGPVTRVALLRLVTVHHRRGDFRFRKVRILIRVVNLGPGFFFLPFPGFGDCLFFLDLRWKGNIRIRDWVFIAGGGCSSNTLVCCNNLLLGQLKHINQSYLTCKNKS